MGVHEMNDQELQLRINRLKKTIARRLPDAAKMAEGDVPGVILHQDAFAADYQTEEYQLLGMFIKYLGLYGKEITIHGRNRETLEKPE